MKKILAISGGVDSMVLMHRMRNDTEVVVAHFDHGIRTNSSDDAEFVIRFAKEYGLPVIIGSGNLPTDTSEELARARRYQFLREVAKAEDGEIWTAHHEDDLLESVLINLVRGTGWRGLVPMSDTTIKRPLLNVSKREIWRYAGENELGFRQDQTNNDPRYLRNRVREAVGRFDENTRAELLGLVREQQKLRLEIDKIVQLIGRDDGIYSRELFREVSDEVGLELLREVLRLVGRSATRPQLILLLEAVRTLQKGKKYNLAKNYFVEIERETVKF